MEKEKQGERGRSSFVCVSYSCVTYVALYK